MDDKKQFNKTALDRAASVQKNHIRRDFLKGIAIFFLVFAPFLGWCDLMGEGNNPLAASRSNPMATAKNTTLSKAQDSSMDAPGSAKTETATFALG